MPILHGQPETHTEAQAEAIATRAAKIAVSEVFSYLGYDLSEADDVRRWHANQDWVERKRTGEEKRAIDRRKHVWTAVLTILAGLVVSGLSGLGGLILNGLGHLLAHFTTAGGKP